MSGQPESSKARGRLGTWGDQLDADEFSWTAAVGGWRGVIESTLPGIVFVVIFVITRDLRSTLIAAGATAVVFCVLRLIQRQPLTQALSGLLGVGIGVAWAALSGRGENYFTWGLISAAAFAAALTISILVRRPLAGEVLALVWNLPQGWRSDARLAPLRRRATAVTWVWVAMFALRLGVQWPLWQAGAVAELGVAKLILGIPLFALVAWVSWVALSPLRSFIDEGGAHKTPSRSEDC